MTTTVTPQAPTTTWTIDPVHSVAEFKVKHMMISNVKGTFTALQGALTLNEKDVTQSRIEATIDATSIHTRDPQRDAHLKSPDFFDVERFPTLSFVSTKVARDANGELAVTGDLTMHGVTKPVTFTVEGPTTAQKDPWGNVKIGASATAVIHRKDFGLTWNATLETGGFLVGDEVKISLSIQAVVK
jgi:polyisoprenoid-binding protein YceI